MSMPSSGLFKGTIGDKIQNERIDLLMNNVGGINIIEQVGMTKFPQEAASAWSYFDGAIVGAAYKPIAYVGTQIVKGVNHVFIAEQTLITAEPVRHIVLVTINEFQNNYITVGIDRIV